MNRVCIAGGPRTGKTTLSAQVAKGLGVEARHTDDLIDEHDWSGCSKVIAEDWFEQPGPWLIEGVAVPRALRKWLKANPTGTPCDEVVWRSTVFGSLTPGQARMAKACATVFAEVVDELVGRGVKVTEW